MESRTIAENTLKSKGMILTRSRVDIYDHILRTRSHPTCEEIYDSIKGQNGKLSIATVYNVTEKLVEEKLLVKLIAPNGEMRFDATLSFHGHFYCEHCGRIFDFDCEADKLAQGLDGFEIREFEVKATGLCPECRNL